MVLSVLLGKLGTDMNIFKRIFKKKLDSYEQTFLDSLKNYDTSFLQYKLNSEGDPNLVKLIKMELKSRKRC